MEKSTKPASQDLASALGDTFEIWRTLAAYTYKSSPGAIEAWSYGNTKTGWGFRICQNRKVLVQLLPRDKFFQVAFVFEQKATDAILASDVSEDLKAEIKNAKVGLEGRAIKIEARDKGALDDIKKLIAMQVAN
ncbi:MAG TPA: DUF3788 family protein [Bacteroidia bacterium]|nr:DUF3788 family protein [Bacteroidia bacterium]